MAIGIQSTGTYFSPAVETAADLAIKTGIPENIIIEKFGLYEKHVSDDTMHASDLAIAAGKEALGGMDPADLDVVIYFGSPHKDYHVWTSAPKIQHELGAKNAYAFEIMNVSSCFPIALKVARDMIRSDESINHILLVGGCKESQILDHGNPRARFMFNFADGGAAALVSREATQSEILESAIITDGSFHDDVRIPAGGSKQYASHESVDANQHYIDVKDPMSMKERLDPVSIPNFAKVVKDALAKSGYQTEDVKALLPLHTKRSMFSELLDTLEIKEENAVYLDHHGHMSSLDPCIGLHFAQERGLLEPGDIAVAVSAGTGYTWAATVIRWNGPSHA